MIGITESKLLSLVENSEQSLFIGEAVRALKLKYRGMDQFSAYDDNFDDGLINSFEWAKTCYCNNENLDNDLLIIVKVEESETIFSRYLIKDIELDKFIAALNSVAKMKAFL